jgi:hypothetical protein
MLVETHYHPFPGTPTKGVPNPIKGWEKLALCYVDAWDAISLPPCHCLDYDLICERSKEDLREPEREPERVY